MSKETGGPAFPVFPETPAGHASSFNGITARDYFAAKAMQAYLVAAQGNPPEPDQTANCAYFMADAMIWARK